MALHIFRVVVHGQFRDLDSATRERLRAAAADHEPASTRFTRDGHLTYDATLSTFAFRYELREHDEGPAEAERSVTERAVAMTAERLADAGVTHGELRTRVTDMADVWR
ncbi:MAG TPA: DUF6204 family protein [Microthrixaceae bacterium]|nr:DUF6204 family protein [Microthrixaceae bacterium]